MTEHKQRITSRAVLEERIEGLRDTVAYRGYLEARDRVLEMKALPANDIQAPSEYWDEELSGFEYMYDASPLVVASLRQHTYHVTGLRHYDYRTNRDRPAELLRQKLEALRAADTTGLLVPESRELGGFGFDIAGELYNVDTLKFYEVLIALEYGSALPALREGGERKLVWEIGAGWGGFAAAFKTLFPNTTYVISDLPDTMLFSATYLRARFPEARMAFVPDVDVADVERGALDYDFIFTPNVVLDELALPRLDLALNMVSFQEMSTEQVGAYVRRARELGAPYLFSLNRERSRYNPGLLGVTRIMSDWFWPNQIDVLPVSYVTLVDRKEWRRLADRPNDYRHVIGWPREPV